LVLEALQPLFIEEHLLAQSDFFSLTAPGAGAAPAVIAGQVAFLSAHEVAQLFFSPTAPGAAAAVLSAHFVAHAAFEAQQSSFFDPTAPGAVVDSGDEQAARARTTDPRMAEMVFIGFIAP
jgi:hypothetical protein